VNLFHFSVHVSKQILSQTLITHMLDIDRQASNKHIGA
jgi:hypothetical protein